MATAAFKSSTKRSTFAAAAEDAGSSNRGGALRRPRSLSCHSGRLLPPFSEELEAPRGGPVNKARVSGIPEISLDDLADEFLRRLEEDEEAGVRPVARRSAEVGYTAETDSSRRRGRSVSRNGDPAVGCRKGALEVNGPRRQRSVSVARSWHRDSEVEMEPTVNMDDRQSRSLNRINAIDEIRRNYTTKLAQSEKRRQDLLADLAAEEQRGQELMKIVRELPNVPKQTAELERSSQPTRMNADRTKMSKNMADEAEKYFEDFLSSIEDTDLSSIDGERSDTSSTRGGNMKLRYSIVHNNLAETHESLINAASVPVETDGVVLPWLQWEKNLPSPSKFKARATMTSLGNLFDASRELSSRKHEDGNCFTSSRGSWSPQELNGSCCNVSRGIDGKGKGSYFNMDDYTQLQRAEDLLFERLRQRQRIESGSLILCGRT